MKNKMTSLFVAICATAFLYSCNGGMNPAKMFVKKWQVSSIKSQAFDDQKAMDTTKDSAAKAMAKQTIDMGKMTMDAMKQMTLTCNGDGTCETSMNMM